MGIDTNVFLFLDLLDFEAAAHVDYQFFCTTDQPIYLEISVRYQADLIVDGTKLVFEMFGIIIHFVEGRQVQMLPDATVS